jgi:hypothetical protein
LRQTDADGYSDSDIDHLLKQAITLGNALKVIDMVFFFEGAER